MSKNKTERFDIVAVSKVVSHALRHAPWLYELELDEEGWAPVESVLEALRSERPQWGELSETDLAHMIAASSKRRHEIRGGKIRALYGHSIAARLRMVPAVPPDVLYHGTSPASVPSIQSCGLLPMGRQYVHLSVDDATAREVGRRKSPRPVILRVLAGDADARGTPFYEGNERIWLADRVPAEFIVFQE